MIDIQNLQFMTDDGELVSIFISDALTDVDPNLNVLMQIPVFTDGKSGHIHVNGKQVLLLSKNPVIREATRWALSSRMLNYKPRT